MEIEMNDIVATYVDSITIDIQLVGGKVVTVRVNDEDELQTDEWFFDDQQNIDWLMGVGQVIE